MWPESKGETGALTAQRYYNQSGEDLFRNVDIAGDQRVVPLSRVCSDQSKHTQGLPETHLVCQQPTSPYGPRRGTCLF
jgi:hypothetical protein